MENNVYSYKLSSALDIVDVEATLTLAILATESLHGESRVRLEAQHTFDAENRTCTIDADGDVGRDLNRLFLGLISREFGPEAFHVRRGQDDQTAASVSAA